ncbi:mediator of RNA polymerase II transcription subunit 9 [Tachyglossus aculeatus]|uniref:mediator of RNA polymerase II transcription subunit 9 n=1 Tax=Tachyglossus aculeatus TaxID=9261 RepID=UPI0018F6842E|nr:mediator of RNA polymerase II transcription subunit 9 [Tachyglossus aculeatus]
MYNLIQTLADTLSEQLSNSATRDDVSSVRPFGADGKAMAAAGGEGPPQPPPQPPQEPPDPKPPPPPPPPPGLKEDDEDSYSFLPLVHAIIKCMDKDSPDIHQELSALKTKFQEMRKVISTMPGIGLSPEQQQQQLQSLREQVRTKNELLQKYKSLCMFEIPKE